ncbi:hypothetical protein LCER1_G005244 [Lachnellula cervina]|uniref:Uncharacterized protein n=1 Tax=Lachnellula cervina TaxID=1316786 RepID=A0A7D8URJ1_9HELO|nr:hypothetical protein LCER1_G005244 [Lachnellula cervina]
MAKYDRDTAVAAVASFYEFFAALPASSPVVINYPPVGGWPDITPESLAPLKKTDKVIDLYKHLPYPKDHIEISFSTSPTWWYGHSLKPVFERPRGIERISPCGAGEIPAHVAILTNGGRDGSWLFLDTEEGTITDWIQQEHPERAEPSQDSPDAWRAYRTLPITEFFEEWKVKFRSLEWMRVLEGDDYDTIGSGEGKENGAEMKALYVEYGWQTDQWRPDDFKVAALAWRQKMREEVLAMDEEEEESDV